MTFCTQCNTNTISNSGSTDCTVCEAGTVANEDNTECGEQTNLIESHYPKYALISRTSTSFNK